MSCSKNQIYSTDILLFFIKMKKFKLDLLNNILFISAKIYIKILKSDIYR